MAILSHPLSRCADVLFIGLNVSVGIVSSSRL